MSVGSTILAESCLRRTTTSGKHNRVGDPRDNGLSIDNSIGSFPLSVELSKNLKSEEIKL